MNPPDEPLSIVMIPLTNAMHQQADQHCQHQANWQKAEQLYLNTLAVQAVYHYLTLLGFATDLASSDSSDPILNTTMDVADLVVKDCGRLECRPVLPNAEVVTVPTEAQADRIGYVVVELSDDLEEATLLGYTPTIASETFPLSQLHPLDELPTYLRQRETRPVTAPIALTQWVDDLGDWLEAGWRTIAEVLTPQQLAYSFRHLQANGQAVTHQPSRQAVRGKVVDLSWQTQVLPLAPSPRPETTLEKVQVALVMALAQKNDQEVEISVKVYPTGYQPILPPDLYILVLDEAGNGIMQAQSRGTEEIELQFSGEMGECFSVKLVLGTSSFIESFVI